MIHYTSVTILFNPNSTGAGKDLAKKLKHDLKASIPKQKVDLVATKHRGHAEQLAYKFAKASSTALVISASGDGGYNEVVNGLMRARNEGSSPIAGLLPAGNANDHYHHVHKGDIAQAISSGSVQTIDLLKLESTAEGKSFERYAHSYIGLGLTPKVGRELNRHKLNRLNEIGIVLKVLFILKPIKLQVDGMNHKYDSLIFSNISKMSKVLALSDKASSRDGKFEVTAFRRYNKLRLITALVKASTTGLKGSKQTKVYTFKTIKPTMIQLDGEIFTIDPQTQVDVSLEEKSLKCIV